MFRNLSKSKNLVWLFILFLLFISHARAADKISKETFNSQGRKRTYYLYAPGSAQAPTPRPLIILLHGSGRNGLSLVDKWKDLGDDEGVILVGPDARDSQTWRITEDGPDFVRDLVETLKAKHSINPRRVYLFGHSGGAVFALNLSMMESEYFAATAVHAGSWRDEREPSVIDYASRKIPLAVLVGDRDPYFPLNSVRATEVALKARGFPVEVTVINGHDHWYYDLAPEINRRAWQFLKQHELSQDPRFVAYNDTGEADDINLEIRQINALTLKANEAMNRFQTKEAELNRLDYRRNREAAAGLARSQIELLAEIASTLQELALRSDRVSKLKLKGNYSQYFSLIAQAHRKRIQAIEAMRERAELWLIDEVPNAVITKMNEAAIRAERLNNEATELELKAQRVKGGA